MCVDEMLEMKVDVEMEMEVDVEVQESLLPGIEKWKCVGHEVLQSGSARHIELHLNCL